MTAEPLTRVAAGAELSISDAGKVRISNRSAFPRLTFDGLSRCASAKTVGR